MDIAEPVNPDAEYGPDLSEGLPYFVDHVKIANPAADTALVFPLDAQYEWRPLSLRFVLVTSAVAGNRVALIDIADTEGTPWVRVNAPITSVANSPGDQLSAIARFPNVISGTLISGAKVATFGIPKLWIPRSWLIVVSVDNMQAGDQLSAITLLTEKRRCG